MNFCVFASTNGTDLQAIIDEMQAGKMEGIDLKFVLVNQESCGAAEKAKKAGIPLVFINQKNIHGKKMKMEVYDRLLYTICQQYEVDLIVLVGWMRILSPWFVQQFPKKIINVHPSLLPKYPGMDMKVHQAVLDNEDPESGMTIHYVDEKVDHGEIILQKSVKIEVEETAESLKEKVQELEKKWYPEVIRDLSRKD